MVGFVVLTVMEILSLVCVCVFFGGFFGLFFVSKHCVDVIFLVQAVMMVIQCCPPFYLSPFWGVLRASRCPNSVHLQVRTAASFVSRG